MSDMSDGVARLSNLQVHGVSGPTVVIGGGIGTSASDWAKVVESLSAHCRVVTYSSAGSVGAADELFSAVRHRTIYGFADDIRWLLAEVDLSDVVFVGHAYIGPAAVLAAVADPGCISKLVLLNSCPRYRTDPDSGYHGGYTDEQVRSYRRALTADNVTWRHEFVPYLGGPGEAITTFEQNARGRTPIVATTIASAVFSLDIRDVLPRCTAPALVMQARATLPVPPGSLECLVDHLPSAQGVVLEADGQFPHVTDPDEVLGHLLPFILADAA